MHILKQRQLKIIILGLFFFCLTQQLTSKLAFAAEPDAGRDSESTAAGNVAENVPEEDAVASSSADSNEEEEAVTPDDDDSFTPTVQISEDLSVSFPVNI